MGYKTKEEILKREGPRGRRGEGKKVRGIKTKCWKFSSNERKYNLRGPPFQLGFLFYNKTCRERERKGISKERRREEGKEGKAEDGRREEMCNRGNMHMGKGG